MTEQIRAQIVATKEQLKEAEKELKNVYDELQYWEATKEELEYRILKLKVKLNKQING